MSAGLSLAAELQPVVRMVVRGACATVVALMIACESSPPEDIDYPPLPDRYRSDSSETSPTPKSAILEAVDASTGRNHPFDRTAIDPAPAGADAGACASEIEPNDLVPSAISHGKTCGALDGQGDIDQFVFYPSKATRFSVVSATGLAGFYVDDTMGPGHYQIAPGQTITVGPSSNAWVATATAPRAVSYVVFLEEAP